MSARCACGEAGVAPPRGAAAQPARRAAPRRVRPSAGRHPPTHPGGQKDGAERASAHDASRRGLLGYATGAGVASSLGALLPQAAAAAAATPARVGVAAATAHTAELASEVARLMGAVRAACTPLDAYRQLIATQVVDERVFYAALAQNVDELLPILYTPTVGEACQRFSELVPRPRHLRVSADDRGRVSQVVAQWPVQEGVKIAVVTDGERILGLGDLGTNGAGIAVGKCIVYATAGGIEPSALLPIALDVGTENEGLRDDPLYLGLRQPRVRGDEYTSLVDELSAALRERYGASLLLHFEDFAGGNAFRLLERYRARGESVLNDDIQSTAVVIVAALRSAEKLPGAAPLAERNVVFFGAGQANLGGAELLAATLAAEASDPATARDAARTRLWLVDRRGLLTADRTDLQAPAADPRKLRFAHARPEALPAGKEADLAAIVRALKPAALVGATGATPGAFASSGALREMGKAVETPVILALSNPTSLSECTAREALDATGGRAVFAAGSPFAPLKAKGGADVVPAFANNALVFPGIGLATTISGASSITEGMLVAAANGLAGAASEDELAARNVLPAKARAREAALAVAATVAAAAEDEGVADARACYAAQRSGGWRAAAEAAQWSPESV